MLAELIRGLATDDTLVDEILRAAGGPTAATRAQVATLLVAGCEAFLRTPDAPATATGSSVDTEFGFVVDFSAACRFGAELAARGVPVAGLIAGVHAGRSRLLEIAVDRGRAAGIADEALLRGLLKLETYGRALERHVIDGHRSAASGLDRDDRAARMRVLRRVLLDDTSAQDDPARFGLRDDGHYHCLISDVADPARVRALEEAVARCGGVLAPVDGRISGLTPRLPTGRAIDPPVLIVATPPVPLTDAPAAHRLCLTALHAARTREHTGVCRVTDLAAETALAAQPLLGSMLAAELLAALDPADEFHRQLACTALAYLDRGHRLDLTAAALHLHPNTVRYRLHRLTELTGFTGSLSVPETVRWWWALSSWSRRPSSLDAR
ncbi:helix-turn-helix domain-containing protein [Paractinoplanes atraurantiacus]|uniref:PucR C-terminal helix-turn-helix domain-containing protein n=1 Tax=Paractinoplanes atraurantiacus TaxID=1036182 RepID=A0A285J1N2_9ACTN|nr:helix-turn-helix domain-containing protein [Actinoplanes atraurantiacus]SNY54225.1 PucR C-terminal helix-turn-helix domain-containing protein [Actinoplanes atraurantiacus]